MNQHPIYLDKMCASPHFPKQDGSLDATSKVILPNLKRTGIRSKYSKAWLPPAVDVNGKITNSYIQESTEQLKELCKIDSETAFADNSFNLPHRKQLNKLLIKLDRKRESHMMKTRFQLEEKSKIFGFDTIHSDSLCPSPVELATLSLKLNTMKTRSEKKRIVYSRMTLFESLVNESRVLVEEERMTAESENRYDVSSRSSSVQLPSRSTDSRSNSLRMKNSSNSRNGSPDKNCSTGVFMNSNADKNKSLNGSADINRGNSNYDRNRSANGSMNGSPDKNRSYNGNANMSSTGSADVSRSNSARFRSKSPVIPEISTEFNS